MHRRTLVTALAGGTVALSVTVPALAQPAPEILARFPNGTFLENLVVASDGRVIFTNYFARTLEAWSPAAGHARFAEVPQHPVSLTALVGGRHALVVHGVAFNRGPEAMRGEAAVLIVEADGRVARRIALAEAIFPNGALLLAPQRLLVADSALGLVWAVDLGTGEASRWLADPMLAPVQGQPYPGVNGIKRSGNALLLSNSAQRLLLRQVLSSERPEGTPALLARMGSGVDDFDIAPGGTVFAATHAVGIARLLPGASEPGVIPAPGVEGNTAVALTPDGRGLYALGTGGLFSGGKGEAVLARIALPA
ncbi:SMP-30/gluconolactonase/LRE family protein [Elioraea rosea]|uniref:hypothetical protein n=1 Tax=Elioraea rosea TaxID=2492390 RepID=UPI0011853231|nr:hypothetical protein [Elioraea rosea]